jgi:hypothetical protein
MSGLMIGVLPDPEVDAEAAERLARQLRAELSELGADVEFAPAGVLPEGAKGDLASVSAMVVALTGSGGVVAAVVATLRDYLGRDRNHHRVSLTIDGDTIELEHASSEQQRQLVDAFVRRHSAD